MQKKIITQYYVLSCLFNAGGMSVICAIYVVFLIRNGLNLFQVNMVNASFFLTMFVCEIPTGAFADIFGRKKSFVIACAIMCASMFVYGLSHTFAGFITAEMMCAIAITFRTGAFKAWLVDSLKYHGYTGELNGIFGRNNLIVQVSGGAGAIIGSYLYSVNPALPWFVGGTSMAVTTVTALIVMKEDYFERKAFSWKKAYASMKEVTVKSVRYGLDDKAVRFILLATGIQVFSFQALNMYWQPFFQGHGVNPKHLGFIFAGVMGMAATGAWIASRLKTDGKEKRMIFAAQIISGIMAMAIPFVFAVPAMVLFYLLHEIPRGAIDPLMDSYLQKRIPSSERATISSFCATAPEISGAIGLLASGAIAQCFGIATAWVLSGLALVIGALWLGKNGNGKDG